jgi:hypothetical protein
MKTHTNTSAPYRFQLDNCYSSVAWSLGKVFPQRNKLCCLQKIPLRVYSYYLYRLTGSLGCVCDSLLNTGISIFVAQNSAVWKEHFEIVLRMEKMNGINTVVNVLVNNSGREIYLTCILLFKYFIFVRNCQSLYETYSTIAVRKND